MPWLFVIGGLLLLGAIGFGRHSPRAKWMAWVRRAARSVGQVRGALLSPVTQQHLHLFHGGRLSADAVARAKSALARLLARGEQDRADEWMRPGLNYAVQVQALAELGGASAVDVLHRQLHRRVSGDPIEQCWYWIDVAQGLRRVNRADSLPHLLDCPASGEPAPLGQYFAAETACCPGFAEALHSPSGDLGRTAVRVLYRTLHGLRHGVSPVAVVEARLGAAVATLWRHRPERLDPVVIRTLMEALRLVQRAQHFALVFRGQAALLAAFREQVGDIARRSAAIADYLSDAKGRLLDDVSSATDAQRVDYLLALDDLRVDSAAVLFPRRRDWPAEHRALGVRLLRWSSNGETPAKIVDWIRATISPERRARPSMRSSPPRRPSVPQALPYAGLLYALRGHASPSAEELLVVAARDWDPIIRTAAVSSLGWWEPLKRSEVAGALQKAREDANADVRRQAEAALARLGERRALQVMRAALVGESEGGVPDAIRFIAAERLFWLWPELDALADADELETALAAREALEQMREDLAGGLLLR
jgi:hypothetical protein